MSEARGAGIYVTAISQPRRRRTGARCRERGLCVRKYRTIEYWRERITVRIGAPGEIRTPDPLVRSWRHENRTLILLINSAWRPLHLAPPSTTDHYQTRKSPATTWSRGWRASVAQPSWITLEVTPDGRVIVQLHILVERQSCSRRRGS
jgi:hypothetical protein